MTSGAREAAKWIALALMTLDHAAWIIGPGHDGMAYHLGRVVFPTFALVLGANLSTASKETLWRVTRRLTVASVVSAPFAAFAFGQWWPFNVLATLALGVAAVAITRDGRPVLAAYVLLALGGLVDYLWLGPLLVVACVAWWRSPSATASFVLLAVLSALAWLNASLWTFGAVPLLALMAWARPEFPRLKWAFYAYYPAHLAVLGLVSMWV